MNKKENKKINIIMMTQCAVFVVLIAVGAFIKIPMWPVPFTLQTMFTNMAGLLLGRKYGAIATGLYVAIGLMGIPIFTSGGGIGYVLYPTFGYMIGMILGSYLGGAYREKRNDFTIKTTFIAGLINTSVVYVVGVPYFITIMKFYTNSDLTIGAMLMMGFVTTLPADIAKCAIASIFANRVGGYVGRT